MRPALQRRRRAGQQRFRLLCFFLMLDGGQRHASFQKHKTEHTCANAFSIALRSVGVALVCGHQEGFHAPMLLFFPANVLEKRVEARPDALEQCWARLSAPGPLSRLVQTHVLTWASSHFRKYLVHPEPRAGPAPARAANPESGHRGPSRNP